MLQIKACGLVTVWHPELEEHLRSELEFEFGQGPVNLRRVRSLVSSPRLMSFYVKAFWHPAMIVVGDSYLDAFTMLADSEQKTFAISVTDWLELRGGLELVNEFSSQDASVMSLHVWPFDPHGLTPFAMAIAVALSYTPDELMAESRISLAIGELVEQWGYFTDGF